MSSRKGMIVTATFVMQSPPRRLFALHCPWLSSGPTYSGAACPVQRHDRTSRSARYAGSDTGNSYAYVQVDRRERDIPSDLCCSRRNGVLQQQHSSLRIVQPEQTTGDAACVHGRHSWWVRTGTQYITAWTRMDERGLFSRDVKFDREANVGETREDARTVAWERCRIFFGGMT